MTYTQEHSHQDYCECEFTVPIKLNVPITINSEVCINYIHPVKQKLPVFIQPDLMLEPEVKGKAPKCYRQNGYGHKNGQSEDLMQSV
ncbi:MAG: hypothetical protein F6J89_26695 [Symploca sp. SIO1C4]|uniref:Uncharacterized protein n=1 Tax=Symploca sp. SIO1C4 TaxID=2607765 RepID=A0A6B3NHE0_9CYAN|nr:hypothetical protein [Symploca sp. SIO1C4]NET05633.1 hypothetical protein [Symploca sp. SIO2B6]